MREAAFSGVYLHNAAGPWLAVTWGQHDGQQKWSVPLGVPVRRRWSRSTPLSASLMLIGRATALPSVTYVNTAHRRRSGLRQRRVYILEIRATLKCDWSRDSVVDASSLGRQTLWCWRQQLQLMRVALWPCTAENGDGR